LDFEKRNSSPPAAAGVGCSRGDGVDSARWQSTATNMSNNPDCDATGRHPEVDAKLAGFIGVTLLTSLRFTRPSVRAEPTRRPAGLRSRKIRFRCRPDAHQLDLALANLARTCGETGLETRERRLPEASSR